MPKQEHHVAIPKISGAELRKMLRITGYTASHYSTFIGRNRTYASRMLFGRRVLPMKATEALYLMLGHDMFWSAYEEVTGTKTTPPPTPMEGN